MLNLSHRLSSFRIPPCFLHAAYFSGLCQITKSRC